MNLLKVLTNKDVQSGKSKFRPTGEANHFYKVIPDHGGIIQVTGPDAKYTFIGITPCVDLLVGDWEIIKE